MKKIYFFLMALVLSLPQLTFAQCATCTVTISSSSSAEMNFSSGTYCFTSGTFTGNVSGLSAGATICIGPNAIFKPGNVNGTLEGTIRVYGECVLPTINIGNGFTVENYKSFTFNGNLNYNGNNARLHNYAAGYMLFKSSFQLDKYASITNDGTMQFERDFNTTNTTAFTNSGTVRLNGNFNPSGNVLNQGLVVAQNVININSGANVTNTCKFVSKKGFVNGGYLTNNGLIWITSTSASESHMQNNGMLETGTRSLICGGDFTNNATVKGAGRFHFYGTTRQQGTFTGTNSSAPINFWGNTRYSTYIFDFPQNSNQNYTNTFRQNFTPEDTSNFNCSSNILPLQLLNFDAKAVNNQQVLLSWQTQNEASVKSFVVERSDKVGGNWQIAGNLNAAGNTTAIRNYELTDKAPLTGISYYRLKTIDVDGKETYSMVKQVNLNTRANTIQVYPTLVPKGGIVKLISTEAGNYQLVDISGKTIMNGKLSSGANLLSINLQSGTYTIITTAENNARQHSKIIVQ